MSGPNNSPREGQARQREASKIDRSHQVMSEANASPTGRSHQVTDAELRSLRIDRTPRSGGSKRVARSLATCIALAILTFAGYAFYTRLAGPIEVEIARVAAPSAARKNTGTVLNATGYVVAAHKIELAAKVVGRVAWIGVDRGDSVKEGHELVRLENEEYRARVVEAEGQIENLQARLAELENGSRPEEIGRASADLDPANRPIQACDSKHSGCDW